MALVTIQRSPSPSNSPESEEDIVDAGSNRQRSFSENYFTVKGAALILPQSDCSQRSSRNNGGDIQQHLQQMFYLLRPEDTIKVAVKLESFYQDRKIWRYMAVVCCNGNQDTEESIILGLDLKEKEATIGLVLPVWANTKITLDGDGGFSVNSEGADYLFKPVSVQAMWSALQSLHKVINTANLHNYIPKGLTHTWVEFYKAKINSDVSCIKEWNLMEDIESYAADSPYSTDKQELDTDGMKNRISIKLRELMMSIDLEETTSKELRSSLEAAFNMSLIEYKSYIDQEMMRILGQMDAPSEIFPFLYLGSEWNASNYDELEENGVNYILNVSREIDNFFPEKYHYMNVREFDNEQSDLMKHWKRTYEFIKKAKENNGKVLVHCKMGVSRSASTVIAFKMKEDGCSFQDAYKFVKDKRSVIRPNKAFMAQLEEYHGILTASRKRFLFGSKSSSEEVDMENGSGFSQLGNEARSLSGFTYYEAKDDPRFLPLDDDNCFAFDHSDLFYDRDDLFDSLEPGQPRARAYTLDNTLPSKFKADDSWITLPQAALHANLLQAKKQDEGLDENDCTLPPMTPVTNIIITDTAAAAVLPSTCTKPIASTASSQPPNKEDLTNRSTSGPHAKIPEVYATADIRCMEMPDGSSKAPTSSSKMAKVITPPLTRAVSLNGSKVTTSPLATTISADGSKVTTYPFAKTVSSDGSKVTTTPLTVTVSSSGSKVATSPLIMAVSSDGSKMATSPFAMTVSSNSSKVTTSPLTVTVSSNGSKVTNPPIVMTVSSDGSKEAVREAEDQAMAPCECGPNNNNNNHNNNNNNNNNNNEEEEALSDGVAVPVRYAKDNIPWNLGSVRKQREKMEEHIKTGSKTGTEAETVTEDGGTSWEILKKDEETPISDHHATPPEQVQAPSSSFSTMHSSPPKLKTSHSFSTFPVGAEEAQGGTPAGGGAGCDTVTVAAAAERPQSVCLATSGKDLLGTLGGSLKDSFQGSVHDPLFDPMNPVSVYEMEDIDLPAGIVRRTTKELEEKNRSSCHELTAVGLFHEETKNHPVQRSLSLGSESDRPRLERTKRRKTCTPILSPGNFGSSELLFYQQSGSLDCGDLYPDVGHDSEMLHPLYPAASMEDHLLSSYTEGSQVKDIMVYRYGAEQVEITGGSVRRRMKNYESLAKESFDKETDDLACLSESPNQATLTTALSQATSSKATPPSSTPPTATTTTAATANVLITTASKTSTCVSPKNTASTPAAVNATTTTTATATPTAQVTPKALRKQEEFQGSGDKSQILKTVKDPDKDGDPCSSKATPVTLPSKTEKSSKEQGSSVNVNMPSVLLSSEEPSILSGCVTKMTKQIEQMSKEPLPSTVKDLPSSKLHLFEGAAMSNALDSPLSCHPIERESECHAVASSKDSGSKNLHLGDESNATQFDSERIRLLKAKSMDESMLAVPLEGADIPPGDGKTVRHLVGKFDPLLVKDLENGTAPAKLGDSPTPPVSSSDGGCLQSKMSEVVSQGTSGTQFHASPKKMVPAEPKSSPRCAASQVLPNTFGAIDCPSSSAEISSSVGVSKPLMSTSLGFTSHKLTHLPATTPLSTTSSITTTTTTTTAVASVAMTTTSIATATSSSTATPTAIFPTASTKCMTQTGSVNTQPSNVQSFQWWSQNMQCRTGGSTGPAPCPHSAPTTTSTSVTSTSASSPAAFHNVPISTAAAAAASSSTSSLTWRPPFMSESRAFLQEGRKVRKLQGKTHPLSKLEGRQYSERRNANPSFYSTM